MIVSFKTQFGLFITGVYDAGTSKKDKWEDKFVDKDWGVLCLKMISMLWMTVGKCT